VRPIASKSGGHLIGTGLAYDVRNREQIEFFLDHSKLFEVLKRRQPTKWFWCDMTDMFGEWVPDAWIDRCFAVMALTPQHTHQVLTKRADRMQTYMEFRCLRPGMTRTQDALINEAIAIGVDQATAIRGIGLSKWPLPNVWLGVSVENQQYADERIPLLLQTPAAVRFISAEPLLGPLDFGLNLGVRLVDGSRWSGSKPVLDWLIVGGESGPGARPFDLAWARSIVQQCQAAGVACFVKQLGTNAVCRNDEHDESWPGCTVPLDDEYWPRYQGETAPLVFRARKGGDPSEWPEDLRVREFPAVAGG
jgi:protein gp37